MVKAYIYTYPSAGRNAHTAIFYVLKYEKERIEHFTELLIEEITQKNISEPLNSIYFGGGTPYLLGPKNIEKILDVTGYAEEITLEANPDDITIETMNEYKKVGINRVSIGIQSFNDDLLAFLGRNHSSKKAQDSIFHVYDSGISNITIDLMYDVPNQDRKMFKESLEICKNLPIKHLSLYNLTIEPYTRFHKKRKTLEILRPSSEDSTAMLNDCVETLSGMGLKRYEISAFAKEGFHSIHNTGYWKGTPFYGVGPSAFSYIDGARFQNVL